MADPSVSICTEVASIISTWICGPIYVAHFIGGWNLGRTDGQCEGHVPTGCERLHLGSSDQQSVVTRLDEKTHGA